MTPRLSVVIPTYNRSEFLTAAVESVLAQEEVAVEVIVVDDGSTDDTRAVVENSAARWGERVRYLWQENAERSVARNHGLRHARGEFVAFLDSDDLWRPRHARLCLERLEAHPHAVAVYTECGQITEAGEPIRDFVKRRQPAAGTFRRDLCLKRLILHPTEIVIRRELLVRWMGEAVFDPAIPGAEDWLLWIQLAGRGEFLYIPEATVWMRLHPGSTFGDPDKFEVSLMGAAHKVVATGLPERLGLPAERILAINHTHCAYAHYLSGQMRSARAHLRRALGLYRGVVLERDFWMVVTRLLLGSRVGRHIRTIRHRARPGLQTD